MKKDPVAGASRRGRKAKKGGTSVALWGKRTSIRYGNKKGRSLGGGAFTVILKKRGLKKGDTRQEGKGGGGDVTHIVGKGLLAAYVKKE